MSLKRAVISMLCLALGAVLGSGGVLLAGPPPPEHVVLIVLDALRADRLGATRAGESITPNLDRLAAGGQVFSNCYSASTTTKVSLASILTGAYPAYHGVLSLQNTIPPQCPTIAGTLGRLGFHTACIQTNPWLVPEMHAGSALRDYGFHKGFAEYRFLDPGGAKEETGHNAYAPAAVVNNEALKILARRPRRLFLYLHYMDTHQPYMQTTPRPFTGAYLAGDERSVEEIFAADQALVKKATGYPDKVTPQEQRRLRGIYDEAVRYTDDMLGKLLGAVDATIGLQRTLVVVTADHGEQFGEHGGYGHPCELYEELVRVPLILAGPGVPRGPVTHRVSNVHLHRTIKGLVSPDRTGEDDIGLSLMARRASEPVLAQVMVYSNEVEQCKRTKLIRPDGQNVIVTTTLADKVLSAERFDLNCDPAEHSALPGDGEALTQQALRLVRDYERLARRDGIADAVTGLRWQWRWDNAREAQAEPALSENERRLREQLRSLGYLQ